MSPYSWLPDGAGLAAESLSTSVPEATATFVLAVVQGLTEFLPVSSSGHLVLFGEALGLEDPGLLLPIALHLGTLLAVLIVYRKDVFKITADLLKGRPREALLVILGTLPAGVVGVLFQDFFRDQFGSGRSAAMGLLATAALLLTADRARRSNLKAGVGRTELNWLDALLIGTAQAVAILPGISRSGSTIAVGLLRGIEPLHAARFSFLLSIPAILGAALLEIGAFFDTQPSAAENTLLGLGLLVSALVGWVALRLLISFLNRGAFVWFAAYCAAVGVGYLALVG